MSLNLKIFYRTDPRVHKCPECGNMGGIKQSRTRNFIEKIVKSLTTFRTYRCKECGWRGYKSGYFLKWASLRSIFYYLVIFAVTAYLVSFILQRFIIK